MCSACAAPAPVSADRFRTTIALLRERWDVLRHPFYQRWSGGRLTNADLQRYATEYHHTVTAIAQASTSAAALAEAELAPKLEQHASEEVEHIDLWMQFARATGWCSGSGWYYAQEPYEETRVCASVWSGGPKRSLPGHLVTLYAIESAQPRISETKLSGLLRYYGFEDGPATEYFRVHAQRDCNHAAMAREAFETIAVNDNPGVLLSQAEAVYRAYWEMLDRLESECPSS